MDTWYAFDQHYYIIKKKFDDTNAFVGIRCSECNKENTLSVCVINLDLAILYY